MRSPMTVLCYIKKEDSYLMLHRIKREHDINKDMWIGVGGHFEEGESPEECLLREVKEETGLQLEHFQFKGMVTFQMETGFTEYMCLYEADSFYGELIECEEGALSWVPMDKLLDLNLWEGDYIFLDLMQTNTNFFSLKLVYDHKTLKQAILNGKEMELLDLCDEEGNLTGKTRERTLAHKYGSFHRTSHVWIVCKTASSFEILLQKRSSHKDSYPDCFDISSAGHILAGYEFKESAVREVYEELGIQITEDELEQIGIRKIIHDEVFHNKNFKDRQISRIYIVELEKDTIKFQLQKDEVSDVSWFELEELMRQLEQQKIKHCIHPEEIQMVYDWCKRNGL